MKEELIGLGDKGCKYKECWCLLNQSQNCPNLLIAVEICIELNTAHKYSLWLGIKNY